jgi:murein L,D-transpeptidase YafK
LAQSLLDIRSGRLDEARARVAGLVDRQPDFSLAQLVYGDVLSALAGRLPSSGTASSPELAGGFRDEARARWNRYLEAPPQGAVPAGLIEIPASVAWIVLVDLNQFRLHFLEHRQGRLVRRADYYVSIGKGGTDKRFEGDEKTPVGIYTIESYLPGSRLPDLYGAGALPISYPNAWDRLRGRTGSGIWIHGTESRQYSRPPLSSRGCVTLSNSDFVTLWQALEIERTLVVVSRTIDWAQPNDLPQTKASIRDALEQWKIDWESLDTERYLQHYSASFRAGQMSRARFAAHKRSVNRAKTFIQVELDEVGIYSYPGEEGLMLVEFQQRYESDDFRSQRRKKQYWRQEEDRWRIVYEGGA